MNYELNIRKANINDAPLIAKVVAMAIGEEGAKYYCGDGYQSVLEEIACLENSQYSYKNTIIAEVNGIPAGAAVAYDGADLYKLREITLKYIFDNTGKIHDIEDETDASEVYLDSIAVLPKYRGLGIGKRLLLTLKEIALNEYNKNLGLLVDFENPDAERLYKSVGFERMNVKDFLGHKMWHLIIRLQNNK
jgi:ribosomal protein S18 acetylase RimI-like enzyme